MEPINLLVVGAGSRGSGYASYAAAHPDEVRVVGVAEPREIYRQRMVEEYDIAQENAFADWRQAAAVEKFADAVVVATQDAMHVEPAEAFAAKGYHLLLEKPMAPDEEGCRRIHRAVKDAGVMLAVCHVVRYTAVTQKIKQLLDQGAIGEIVSVQRFEPVGYWHQAHSFVRGNWRNETESSAMLLAKSCHDVDWLRYIVGQPCKQVSSFGNLKHFRAEEKPVGAAQRCIECELDSECAYSARKIYMGRLKDGQTGWPVDVLAPDISEESVLQALVEGPYGRCVYDCDNDVVDHQVVNFLFAGGATAAFTMTAFAKARGRETRIFGTKGELFSDDEKIEVFDFLTDELREVEIDPTDPSILGGHGGGDYGLMQCFVAAVINGDPTRILSGPDETLESHLMVFAAERARKNGTVETVASA